MHARNDTRSPLVSIIVPVYNRRELLPELLANIEQQTYPDFEVLFVDDGSTDGSAEFLDELAGTNCRVIRGGANRGPSAARNTGLRQAVGEYIQFLDSDDLLHPDKLAHDVTLLQVRPELGLVTCDAHWFRGSLERRRGALAVLPFDNLLLAVLGGNPIPLHGPLLRKAAIEHVGPLAENSRGCEDWEYWLRVAAAGIRGAFVPGVRAYCRFHPGQRSRQSSRVVESAARVLARAREVAGPRATSPQFCLPLLGSHSTWAVHARAAGRGDVAAELCTPAAEWLTRIPPGCAHAEYPPGLRSTCGRTPCWPLPMMPPEGKRPPITGARPSMCGPTARTARGCDTCLTHGGPFIWPGTTTLAELSASAGAAAVACHRKVTLAAR